MKSVFHSKRNIEHIEQMNGVTTLRDAIVTVPEIQWRLLHIKKLYRIKNVYLEKKINALSLISALHSATNSRKSAGC